MRNKRSYKIGDVFFDTGYTDKESKAYAKIVFIGFETLVCEVTVIRDLNYRSKEQVDGQKINIKEVLILHTVENSFNISTFHQTMKSVSFQEYEDFIESCELKKIRGWDEWIKYQTELEQ